MKYTRLDDYWSSIGEIIEEKGMFKYQQLVCLSKAVLSISHGNVVPERGFSINKYLLFIHGNNLSERTLVALRLVKDELCELGDLSKVKITKELLKSVKTSSSR